MYNAVMQNRYNGKFNFTNGKALCKIKIQEFIENNINQRLLGDVLWKLQYGKSLVER